MAWLSWQGFTVKDVARSRNWLVFSGTAEQTSNAFHTAIHRYRVNGVTHCASATDPSIPAALADIVSGLRGLNSFHLKPRSVKLSVTPEMTQANGTHHIAPDDLATIYDISPLYKAGIDGSGQKIAVVGQTDIRTSDIRAFRTKFNLPAANIQQVLVPSHPDPGISDGDLGAADLDIEWAGAVAPNATIVYAYSDDVLASLNHVVDQNLAPVVTMSYGSCEASDLIDLPTMLATARQANAQGITWLAAAGDAGARIARTPTPQWLRMGWRSTRQPAFRKSQGWVAVNSSKEVVRAGVPATMEEPPSRRLRWRASLHC